jgi:hypothetical protein
MKGIRIDRISFQGPVSSSGNPRFADRTNESEYPLNVLKHKIERNVPVHSRDSSHLEFRGVEGEDQGQSVIHPHIAVDNDLLLHIRGRLRISMHYPNSLV